jgi:hypothetical protein
VDRSLHPGDREARMSPVSSSSEEPTADSPRPRLRALAHDLGNLSYRLSFLTLNLKAQIPDPGHRAEAVALLEDTTARLQQVIEKLREVDRDV